MTQALTYPRFKALDHAGNPLSGGHVHTYTAGTTTNKATYPTDADAIAGTNALDNPVVLDANGEATIYLNGSYKLLLQDSAGITQWTLDNVRHNIRPSEIDDESVSDAAARYTLDPYPAGVLHKAVSVQEEFWQLRYQLAAILGETYWYIDPDASIATLYTFMNTHDVMTTQGDLIVEGAAAPGRVGVGNAGQIIKSNGTTLSWGVPAPMAGYLSRPQFLHTSDTAISIEPGCYHHSGTVDQIVYWNLALAFTLGSSLNADSDELDAGAFDIQYIYLDDSAIVTNASPLLTNACLLNSDTAPTWSDAKHGWYGPGGGGADNTQVTDRCIFAVPIDSSNDVLDFYHDGGRYIAYDAPIEDMAAADPDHDWSTDVTLSIPALGANAMAKAIFKAVYSNAETTMLYRPKGSASVTIVVGHVRATTPDSFVTIDVYVDSAQKISVAGGAEATNTLAVETLGYFLPRSM